VNSGAVITAHFAIRALEERQRFFCRQ
jgi:hypothetical protein